MSTEPRPINAILVPINVESFPVSGRSSLCTTVTFTTQALCVKITEDTSNHKTVHKAKGDEFDNVLVILRDESHSAFLLNSNLTDNEEQRICYVAISRAIERLYINMPSLANGDLSELEGFFEIIKL